MGIDERSNQLIRKRMKITGVKVGPIVDPDGQPGKQAAQWGRTPMYSATAKSTANM
ncbi:MAG: hypothetical protein U5J83_00755 [Bryobacterales bacterium]|nr:hypothetical protein [Bryobacterales bacterium]